MPDLIPREVIPLPSWLKILFYILVGLLVIVVFSYFILGHFQKKSLTAIQGLDEEINKQKTVQIIAREKEILNEQKKIENFGLMLSEHLSASKFFKFLERTSHPQIWFSQINLSPLESLVALSGSAETFPVLGQQIQILKKETLVENIVLSEISLGKKGKIEFTLNLSFDPQFFK